MEEILSCALHTEEKDVLIDELMKMYGQDILQLVYSYVKDRSAAEELTQDIFIKSYNSLHTYSGKSKLRTWLWKIAINTCKDYLKSWYRRNVVAGELDWESRLRSAEDVEAEVMKRDTDDMLAAAVMELDVPYREAIYLFYFQEMKLKEIAEVTGIKENTVKTRLKRAKELLKKRLEE
ncbi:sigma-70 family RNA polymerase sigma factor [Bacillus lacus]|uniref:Sigma-70 family RNA polymerase sigma factor n=1 Tax=Metabacillus lacus TaxID=1983721 RepID=A0A7X2M0I7_9BACI|nr:sigma-70 family RNA polymerase sigma factor [Metabacillus lacus]MRX74198.1 sigma-70 family RNA polymerase sigma factor [Metabacillus lacus]